MTLDRIASRCLVATLLALGVAFGPNSSIARQPGPPGGEQGMEVLTRGPVHEAFAETVTFDPEPGIVVRKAAPEAIEEMPPDQKPAGANVDWISGYWAWDDERNDYLWVSGIWRSLPPGRQWVPGYWGRSTQGDQWTSGYWADAQASEVEYLPEPPATVEEGPNSAAPSVNHIWAPGCWVWNQTRYAWQPGYWAIAQRDWTWIPAHYVWAPRGYVFVNGYYDYSVSRRGVLFAPVYFTSSAYAQRGFSYSPVTVINPGVFTSHLFLRPSYGHYYFGDYYGSNYASSGFSPWFSFHANRWGYDPFYAHERWHHRNDRQWDQRVQADFVHRRDHQEARPPRTWTAQRALMARGDTSNQQSFVVAAGLDQLAKSQDSSLRFQAVDQGERQRLANRRQEIQSFRQERQKLETRADTSTAARAKQTDLAKQAAPVRAKLPRSPILAKSVGELGQDNAPPKSPVTPRPDPKFEPKPRVARSSEQSRQRLTNRLPVDTIQPQTDLQSQPRPNVDQPKPQPQLKVDRSAQPQSAPKVTRSPQSQPQTGAEQAQGKRERRGEQPRPQQPQANPTSQAKSQPQPRVEQPRPQPQATPQRQPRPQPQPRVEQPRLQPQPQAKVTQPAPRPQPQPRVERPRPQPQPQAKVESPAPQAQPQPRVDRPTGPRAGPKKDEPKGKA